MIADGRAKQRGCRAAKPAVAAEYQDLGGGLVQHREGIALAVLACDHPAGKLDHGVGDFLALRQLIDGGGWLGNGFFGAGYVGAGQRQRHDQRATDGPECRR